MLPQVHRLPAVDFPFLNRRGIRLHTDYFDVRYVAHIDITRIGIVIPKSADKRATKRNRMKRVLSEQIRHVLKQFDPHIDAVFVVRKPFVQDATEINEAIVTLFHSITQSA